MELSPKELFQAGYKVLLNRERGPKLATLVISIGTEKVSKLFKTI
jgi:lysyl-tRNA synthetase class I